MSRRPPLAARVRYAPRSIVRRLRAIAFWGAVGLPIAYAPLFYGGIDGHQIATLLGLVAINVACLVAGHSYTPCS